MNGIVVRDNSKVIPITEGKRAMAMSSPIVLTAGKAREGIRMRAHLADWFTGMCGLPPAPPDIVAPHDPELPEAGDPDSMKYVIAHDYRIRALPPGLPEPEDAALVFASLADLQRLAAGWPLSSLVRVWNELPGTRAVTRFENRRIALERIWREVSELRSSLANFRAAAAPRRRETKTELVVRMLKRRRGATLEALMKATGWQAHSVRALLSARLAKELGLEVHSERRGHARVYRLVR